LEVVAPPATPAGLPPAPGPLLGWLLAGFVLVAGGLALLNARRRHGPLESPEGSRRALLYALVYGLTAACFARVIAPALLGHDRNPWLLALGDVMFVTLGVFVWVMVLAENRPLSQVGFRGVPAGRLLLTLLMGVGAALLYAIVPYRALVSGTVHVTPDALVFSFLFATVGSAIPDEILFRGYLMASLDGRTRRWSRVAGPALAFTAVRALRYLPGPGFGVADWLFYVAGVVFPLGLWWGLMRDLARGSLWPSLVSHALLEFVTALASASPATLRH